MLVVRAIILLINMQGNLIDKRQVKINICKLQSINTKVTMGDKSNGLLVIKSFTVRKEGDSVLTTELKT